MPGAMEQFQAFLDSLDVDTREAVVTHTTALKSALEKERVANKDAKQMLREGILFDEPFAGEIITMEAEANGQVPSQYLMKVIKPGWGSSGYYAESMLKRDGNSAFPRGTHMYVNHPSLSEETDRPERSLRDLGAVLMEDAHWMGDGPRGPGLYSKAKVFEAFRPFLKEAAPFIGVSIHALGTGKAGEVEGKNGMIIEKLIPSPYNSVDFVTKAGAGGAVVAAIESASPISVLLHESDPIEVVERANTAQYLSSKMHANLTAWVDEMFGSSTITDAERKVIMEALEASMDAFHKAVMKSAPDLFIRMPWSDPEVSQVSEESASSETPVTEPVAAEEAPVAEQPTFAERAAQVVRDAMAPALLRVKMGEAVNVVLSTIVAPSLAPMLPELRKRGDALMTECQTIEQFQEKYLGLVATAVKAAVTTSKSTVRGLGERDVTDVDLVTPEQATQVTERLNASFEKLGLSKAAASNAARGRN